MDIHLLNASQAVLAQGAQGEMQILHLPHGTVAVPHVQDIHIIQQQHDGQQIPTVVVVDHSQAIRNKLEKLAYQIHELNNSDQFQRRFHLSSNWRMNDKAQDPFLYISVNHHQPAMPPPGYLSSVPTFHLIAVGVVERNDADILLRLVAYNGTIAEHLDEKFSQIQDNLSNSKLLHNFVENRFTMCYGLAKLPRASQALLLRKSNFLREKIDEKIIWRSLHCHYAIEKSADGIHLNCCDQCSTILATFSGHESEPIKKEPPSDLEVSEQVYNELMNEGIKSKPKLTIQERLSKLKLRGITIDPPVGQRKQQTRVIEDVDDNFDDDNYVEPLDDVPDNDDPVTVEKPSAMRVTVTMRDGEQTKVVPLDKIRQQRQTESRKKVEAQIPVEKKKAKPVLLKKLKRKRALLEPKDINSSPEEKKTKKEILKAKEETDKQASEKINNHIKKCPICQEPFTDVNVFMTHLSKCNVSSEEEVEEEEAKEETEEVELDENGVARKKSPTKKLKKKKKKRSFPLTALSCGICGQTFKFETHYEPHIKAHEEKLKLDVPVECPLCNENLATKRHLNPHFKKVHPNDGGCCVECLQVMDVTLLKQHLQKQHQQTGAATSHKEAIKGEGHLCPDCGKKCQYLSELEIHMAIQHMGIALERPSAKEEEVMCHECGKVFNHRYRLKQHLSTTHNKSRDHPCPFCAKVFCLKHQLTKHLLTHSDVKPFKCKYCEYQNVRKYRVQKHCQKAHNLAGTDQDIDVMEGGAKPSEFVQNFLNISTSKKKVVDSLTDTLPERLMY